VPDISFSPGFSPVNSASRSKGNRLNGFLRIFRLANTGLKPGENEMKPGENEMKPDGNGRKTLWKMLI